MATRRYASSTTSSGAQGISQSGGNFSNEGVARSVDNFNLEGVTLQVTHHVKAALVDSPLIPLPANYYKNFEDFEKAGAKFSEVVVKERDMVREEVRKFNSRCAFVGENPIMEFAGPDRTAMDDLFEKLENLIELIEKAFKIRYMDTKGWLPNELKHLNGNILKIIHGL